MQAVRGSPPSEANASNRHATLTIELAQADENPSRGQHQMAISLPSTRSGLPTGSAQPTWMSARSASGALSRPRRRISAAPINTGITK